MRRSPLEHPLAVLRIELGLGQTEFGQKVGRHWRTIQSVELGKLPLSAKLAERISDETGISFRWLMAGKPKAPMVDERGLPWKKEHFFNAQGKKLLPGSSLGRHYAVDLLARVVAEACAAVSAAMESKNVRAYAWRLTNGLEKAVDDLPGYADVRQEFLHLLTGHRGKTEPALNAVVVTALQRARKWKEPRPAHKKKKGKR